MDGRFWLESDFLRWLATGLRGLFGALPFMGLLRLLCLPYAIWVGVACFGRAALLALPCCLGLLGTALPGLFVPAPVAAPGLLSERGDRRLAGAVLGMLCIGFEICTVWGCILTA